MLAGTCANTCVKVEITCEYLHYMGRNIPRQHFSALSVTFLVGFKQLQLLDYCIYVKKVKFPRIFGVMRWSGCLQTQKILPGNVCRKWLKFPETPGNPNWWTCNIILKTINEAYLVALSATVTSTYIPVMTPGLLDTFPGAYWDISLAYWIISWTIFDRNMDISAQISSYIF